MKHAIFTDDAIYTSYETPAGRRLKSTPIRYPLMRVSDIVELAADIKAFAVWVMPGTGLSQAAQKWFMECEPEKYRVWYPKTDEIEEDAVVFSNEDGQVKEDGIQYFSYVCARRANTGRYEPDIHIHYIEHAGGMWCEDGQGGLWTIKTPGDLAATVMYLEDAFKTDVRVSAGNVGKRLMMELSRNRLETRLDTSVIPIDAMTVDVLWSRPADALEAKMRYLHQYDKNRQYTGAAAGVRLGIGAMRQVHDYEPGKVGFYRCYVINNPSPFDGVMLPEPFDDGRPWVSHDLVEFALKVGATIRVTDGYVWDESAHTLDKWARHMWAASTALKTPETHKNDLARQNAYRSSKLIANAAIGRLNREYSQELYRPDINRMIIQRARANQLYTLQKYARIGYQPAHIYRDALYFFSNNPDPAAAVPGLLDASDQLRGYKHEYTYPVTGELLAALTMPAATGHRIIKSLKGR